MDPSKGEDAVHGSPLIHRNVHLDARSTKPLSRQHDDDEAGSLILGDDHEDDDAAFELSSLTRPSNDDLSRTLHARSHSSEHENTSRQHSARVSSIWIFAVLILTVLGFALNTEATAYYQDYLEWKKPFASLYVTHSSLMLPWICHTLWLRFRARHVPFQRWFRDYILGLRASIARVKAYASRNDHSKGKDAPGIAHACGELSFLFRTMALVTMVLTIGGGSWFVALGLTTPADLTAISNCSTFFAAVFSVPLLRERLSPMSVAAVALSLVGTMVIAYGDTALHPTALSRSGTDQEEGTATSPVGTARVVGNVVSVVGSMLFGLYEVLLKKWACPAPVENHADAELAGVDADLCLTLAATAMTGFFTFSTVWIGLIMLHVLGIETLVLPSLHATVWILVGVLSGAISLTLLVVLVIWTDPIFGSMVNILTVFAVAYADWLAWGFAPSTATYIGGAIIVVAFGLLARDSLREKSRP